MVKRLNSPISIIMKHQALIITSRESGNTLASVYTIEVVYKGSNFTKGTIFKDKDPVNITHLVKNIGEKIPPNFQQM